MENADIVSYAVIAIVSEVFNSVHHGSIVFAACSFAAVKMVRTCMVKMVYMYLTRILHWVEWHEEVEFQAFSASIFKCMQCLPTLQPLL